MELITYATDFLASRLTTTTYKKIILVYCVRTQLLHGLRAKTKRPSRDGQQADKKMSIIQNIRFNDFQHKQKGCKDQAKEVEWKRLSNTSRRETVKEGEMEKEKKMWDGSK